MADLQGKFDEGANPSTGFELLKDGDYMLQLVESDIVATSGGKGEGLKFKAEITQGEAKGRFIFGFINLIHNESAQAQEIGQSEFAALRKAVGVLSPTDTQDLHFREFKAKIGTQPARKGKDGKEYSASNQIKKYYFDEDDAGSPPASKAEPESKPAETKATTKPATGRPWTKKAA